MMSMAGYLIWLPGPAYIHFNYFLQRVFLQFFIFYFILLSVIDNDLLTDWSRIILRKQTKCILEIINNRIFCTMGIGIWGHF